MLSLATLYDLRELKDLNPKRFRKVFSALPRNAKEFVAEHWYFGTARLNQIIPWHRPWYMQCYKPGRGFGKNWMLSRNSLDAAIENPGISINCFAKTQGECNDTLILGDSGIAKAAEERGIELIGGTKRDTPPKNKIIYLFSKDHIQLRFWNGSIMRFYGANKTRGKQAHMTFVDEIFTWFEGEVGRAQKLKVALEELETITRLGDNPRIIITSTPQPVNILREIYTRREAGEGIVIISGTTFDNKHLSDAYRERMLSKFGGTKRGQQELYGIESWEVPGALWTPDMIEHIKKDEFDRLDISRIVVSIDPAVSNNATSDETGIIVTAKSRDNKFYILNDSSLKASPREWAIRAIQLYDEYSADKIIYEANQGGDLVAETLMTVRRNIPLKAVRASKGKYARAEPIAALYEKKDVFHVGVFHELETQLCEYNPELYKGSPDRLDALVWGLHELSAYGEYDIVVL